MQQYVLRKQIHIQRADLEKGGEIPVLGARVSVSYTRLLLHSLNIQLKNRRET